MQREKVIKSLINGNNPRKEKKHMSIGINPKPEDVGRYVTYLPTHTNGDPSHPDAERGVLTGFDSGNYVFVRFGNDTLSKATPKKRLIFG